MGFVSILKERGLLQDCSDPAGVDAFQPGTPFYCGFDPTASSLQLGNLVPMIVMMHLGRAGLTPFMIFGGATGSIGDPSGKSSERQLLSDEITERNLQNQMLQARAIFQRAGLEVRFVNNLDWTKGLSCIDFLREIGKHLTVNYMLAKDVIKSRLDGEGISFTEFSYMLLQAYDFFHLHGNYGVKLQIGGSDQWGNITAGLELIRKKAQGEAYALSFPLITDSQGRKFGKSAGNALWLDPALTSPYKLHQYFLNIEDASVIGYLKIFSFLALEEIAEIEQDSKREPQARRAQSVLADTVCELVHGKAATEEAKRCGALLFGGELKDLPESALLDIFSEAPSSELLQSDFQKATALDLFERSGLVKSRGDGKKLIASGGAYLNNQRVKDPADPAKQYSPDSASVLILRSGKKNYHLLRIT